MHSAVPDRHVWFLVFASVLCSHFFSTQFRDDPVPHDTMSAPPMTVALAAQVLYTNADDIRVSDIVFRETPAHVRTTSGGPPYMVPACMYLCGIVWAFAGSDPHRTNSGLAPGWPGSAPVCAGVPTTYVRPIRDRVVCLWSQYQAYLGIYMELHLDVLGLHVRAHCTIGHWRSPARLPLSPLHHARLLTRATAAVSATGLVFHFATIPPVDLQHRVLLTVHVQSTLHHRLWSLHSSAVQILRTQQERARVNFHISVDAII